MNESILLKPLCFEAAVRRQLVLKCGISEECFCEHKVTVEVIATSRELDSYDVVVDFRELESVLDEQLKPLQGTLLDSFDVGDILQVASGLAKRLRSTIYTTTAEITDISFIYNNGRRVSLHL